jgi:hypothetical protein
MIATTGRVCKTEDKRHILLMRRLEGDEVLYEAMDLHSGEILPSVEPGEPIAENVAKYIAGIIQAAHYHGGQLILQRDESAAVADALAARLKFEESPLLMTALQKIQANTDVVARRDFHRLQKTLEGTGETK